MKSRYLPFEKAFDEETSTWTLTGKDSEGEDFGVAAASTVERATERLRYWVLDSLVASADDGDDRLGDLYPSAQAGDVITFMPMDLLPIRIRISRARHHLSQADVAERLGISQQAYSKYERPGANLGMRTLQQVERAIDEELLEFA